MKQQLYAKCLHQGNNPEIFISEIDDLESCYNSSVQTILEKRKLAHPMISISDYTKAIVSQGDGEAPLQTVTMQQLPAFMIEDDKLTVILGAIKDNFPIDYTILASNDALM